MPIVNYNSEAEWLALREEHVGGSEIASLFYVWRPMNGTEEDVVRHLFEPQPVDHYLIGCLSPYQTGYRTYMEKAGRIPPSFESNERIEAGNFFEPAIAAWAKARFRWSIRKVRRYMTHNVIPGWGSSLDFETYKGEPVEIKNVDASIFRDEWQVDGEELVPPMHINLQLQHEIGAANAEVGHLLVCVGGNKLLRGTIPHHGPSQLRIADAVTCLWNAVRNGEVPTLYADLDTVAKLYADGDDELPSVDLTRDAEAKALVEAIIEDEERLEALSGALALAKGKLADKLAEATRAKLDGYRVSWPLVRREARLIAQRFQPAATFRGGLRITKGA